MITDKLKANAIALLKMGDSARKVSEDLEIPYMLVKEWAESLGLNDITVMEANAVALARVLQGEVLDSSANAELLKSKIEETAILIVDKAKDYVAFPDLQSAKALELLANTCSKLYMTIVNKNINATPANSGLTLLEQLGRD